MRPRSPCPGAVPRPSPPPGPGGAACDRVPGSRRAPGPGRRRAGACDLRPGSARAERPGAPASDRPPSAASGPRPVLPPGVAPDKGTREPGSGRWPECAAAPQRPRAPACTTTLGESGEGPLNLRSRDPSCPLTSGRSPGDPPPHPKPHDWALGCSSRARKKRKRWIRAALRSAAPLRSWGPAREDHPG